jgi:hypothetical protein
VYESRPSGGNGTCECVSAVRDYDQTPPPLAPPPPRSPALLPDHHPRCHPRCHPPAGASQIDLTPVYELEKLLLAKAATTPLPALYIADATTIIKQRRIERALIEGVQEDDTSALRQALHDVKESPELQIADELIRPAEQVVLRLEIEEVAQTDDFDRTSHTDDFDRTSPSLVPPPRSTGAAR